MAGVVQLANVVLRNRLVMDERHMSKGLRKARRAARAAANRNRRPYAIVDTQNDGRGNGVSRYDVVPLDAVEGYGHRRVVWVAEVGG